MRSACGCPVSNEDQKQTPLAIRHGLRKVLPYARPYWKIILVTFLSMIIYSVGVNGRAYLIKPFLEEVIIPAEGFRAVTDLKSADLSSLKQGYSSEKEEQDRQQLVAVLRKRLLVLIAVAFGVVGLIPLMNYVKEYASSYVINRMLRDLQCDLCDKFLAMPLSYHNKARKGEIFARLNSDVAKTSVSFRLVLGDLLQEPLTLLVGVGAMLYLSWQLTLMIALAMPPLVLLIVRFGRKIRKRSLKRQQKVGDQVGSMIQMFSGIKVVKAFRTEEAESRRFRELNQNLFQREMKVARTHALSRSVTELFNNVTYIVFLGVGVYAILKAMFGLTLPVLVVFLGLATTLYRPIKSLSKAYNEVSDAMGGIERVSEVLDLEPDIRDKANARALPEIREGIRFDHVHFSYDGRQMVLKDIDLTIRKGETIALVGRTGVGKTTLTDLIPRFYDPSQGRILIDGEDVREFTRDSLLQHIAVVTQEPFLFDTSVEENIRYGKPNATNEEIHRAAEAAFIHDMILSLPEGYKTRVGDRGARLSGGERQRITVARAILKNPSILILDEATSSLDADSERWVKMAIANLMKGRTTVAIAHRLSTIQNADKIVVLEDGRITMIGGHEDLLQRDGLYRELCELQFRPELTPPLPEEPSSDTPTQA